ncbi:MAG: hypothetical protein Q9166_002124 [cf. Caloplaca sp. 2 TL-2023]
MARPDEGTKSPMASGQYHDWQLLDKYVSQDSANLEFRDSRSMIQSQQDSPGRCRLLKLPVELRIQILEYVLLRNNKSSQVVYLEYRWNAWTKNTSSVLATSKQFHDEAAQVMYGRISLGLCVEWDSTFLHFYVDKSGDIQKDCTCLHSIGKRYISLIQIIDIQIFVTDYHQTLGHCGVVIDNYKSQVESLFTVLNQIPRLRTLTISYVDMTATFESDEINLHALLGIQNVERLGICEVEINTWTQREP